MLRGGNAQPIVKMAVIFLGQVTALWKNLLIYLIFTVVKFYHCSILVRKLKYRKAK